MKKNGIALQNDLLSLESGQVETAVITTTEIKVAQNNEEKKNRIKILYKSYLDFLISSIAISDIKSNSSEKN